MTEHAQSTCFSKDTKRRENLVTGMGGSDSKLNFRKAVVQLTTKKTVIEAALVYFFNEFLRIFFLAILLVLFAPDFNWSVS